VSTPAHTEQRHRPVTTGELSADHAPRGLIFNVQKFSLHDGCGIRTAVFLKGCPLACAWCSNPEGQAFEPELVYTRDRCIGLEACTRCLPACPRHAITGGADGRVDIDRVRCDQCGGCAPECPARALEMSGEFASVDEVLRLVEEDGAFYVRSGGGLTVTGGEPLSQPAFVAALLASAHGRGLHTALETSGLCPWGVLEKVASSLDEVFYDIKCIDASTHARATGVSNVRILRNFRCLRRRFPQLPVTVRTPIVPGVNDSAEAVQAIVDFIESAGGAAAYELLAYHRYGECKYAKLGRCYPLAEVEPPDERLMRALRAVARHLHAH
jgi:pyruvate formate lyase activating enzyme